MIKQKVYILTGLPYSGKTTLAKELAKRFGFKIISVDEILERDKYNVELMTQQDWNKAYSEGYDNYKRQLQQGYSVVVDIGNLLKHERQTTKDIAESFNIPYQLIYLNASKSDVKQRWLTNLQTQQRDQLEETTFQRALDMFEQPLDDEECITYNQEIDFEQWLEENIIKK